LLRVRQRDHDDVGAAHSLGGWVNLEALLPGDLDGLASLVKADDDIEAAVLEVERVRVAL
jgi:hypothetical protein